MLRPEETEASWKPEYILGQYKDAIRCAEQRNDQVAVDALKNAFVCAWNRAALRTYKGNRL